MARLYSNENFSIPVVRELRDLGHDVLTSQDSGKANQKIPDPDVLAYATEQKRVLLTFNRGDFIKLHIANPAHAGIIVCTFDRDAAALAQRIHEAIEQQEELSNQLIRVNRPQTPP